jgi:hypothetical protein
VTEADILAEVVAPTKGGLSPETARSLLAMKFRREATQRIRWLLRKNNRGTITADERVLLEKYVGVGRFLDLVQAKARLSLRGAADTP